MAASLSEVSTREVSYVSRLILSTEEEMLPELEDSWMTPLIKFIVNNELPELRKLRDKLPGKGKDWVEELPSVLWAYRTTPRAPTQETPFNLVYGSEAVIPVEIGQTSSRVESYQDDNDQIRAMELDLIEEKRERAFIRMDAYRSRIMKSYNKKVRIRDFQVGDLVMKKVNPAGDVGKLEARWEGPYKITRRVSSGSF
ncbi:uncharacterized protein [Primulina eburnea]|uniref:uncharacterized protein n=1 Tax=Primulina eburnea TaxID=1245227 RepID=UPI003C6C50BE